MTDRRAARQRNPRGSGELLRESLIKAAGELVAETGDVERVSVRAVTARAGVSPMALYLHFEGRDELLRAVVEEAFDELRQFVAGAVAGEDPWERLRGGCLAYMRFALERPGHYRILFGTFFPGGRAAQANKSPVESAAFADLVGLVEACLPPGADSIRAALMVWTGMHGRVSLQPVMPRFPFPPADEFVDALLGAFVPRADG